MRLRSGILRAGTTIALALALLWPVLVAYAGPCDEDCRSPHHSDTDTTETPLDTTVVPASTAIPEATAVPVVQPEVAQPAQSIFDGPNDNWTEFGVSTKVTTYYGPLSGIAGTVFTGIYGIDDRRCFTSLREIPGCRDSTLTPNWWHIPGGWVQFGQAFAEAEATAEAGGDQGAQGGDQGAQGGDQGAQGGDQGAEGGDQGAQGGDQGAEGADKPKTVPDPPPSQAEVDDLQQKVDDAAAKLKEAADATSAAGQREREKCADPRTPEEREDCSAARDETKRLAAEEKPFQDAWADAYNKLLDAKRKRKAAGQA